MAGQKQGGRHIERSVFLHAKHSRRNLACDHVTLLAMTVVDLNLLTALDALLAEGSVVGAARRLGLSASAMSRTLARLRAATGDPLLVRAGRGLVPTPPRKGGDSSARPLPGTKAAVIKESLSR
jgi:Bacterial regulatory helix-turn-helix protein, lysR family